MDETVYDGTSTADTGGSSWEAFAGWLGSTTSDLTKIGGQYLINQQQINARQNALQMSSLGQGGYYFDGQTGTYKQIPGTVPGLGMSTGTILLLGGAVVLLMMLKD